MPKELILTPAPSPPPDDSSIGLKEAKLIHASREAILDVTAQRLRLLWEMKKSQAHGGHGGHTGPLPPPSAHKPPAGLEDLLVDAARLSVGNAQDWVKLGNDHFDHIISLLRTVSGTSAPTVPSPARIEVAISGDAGTSQKPCIAKSKPFCLQNPFREEVDIIFTHPHFWLSGVPEPPIGQQFVAQVALFIVRRKGKRWERSPLPHPVPGQPFRIGAQSDVNLEMEVGLAPPFAAAKTYTGEARLISDRRLGGLVSIKVVVKP